MKFFYVLLTIIHGSDIYESKVSLPDPMTYNECDMVYAPTAQEHMWDKLTARGYKVTVFSECKER